MIDVMPPPPGLLAGVRLDGPYDADIPQAKADQIKSAGLLADWAVPYIFLSVAGRFESDGDETRSLAFYDRAISEFRKRNNIFGEGTAWRHKVAALQRFGNDDEAYQSIIHMEGKAAQTPLAAFVAYSRGHYHAEKGDYARALDDFQKAFEANTDFARNADLEALKRDTEMEYAAALIQADYFPAVAGRIFQADFDETFYRDIRRRIFLSLSHLENVQNLNAALNQTAVSRYFPDIVPPFMECDVHNYLGLAFGIRGETQKAFDHLEKAAAIARYTGYHLGKADGIFFLNQVYLLNPHVPGGKQAAYSLQNIADQYQLLPYTVWAKIILAHHEKNAGHIDEALTFIHEFLDLMEKNASWLSQVSDFRGTRHFEPQAIYVVMFDLFIRKGDRLNAFKAAEQIKAAPLVEAFRTAGWQETSAEGQMIRKLNTHRGQILRTYRRLLSVANAAPFFLKTVQAAKRIQKDDLSLIAEIQSQNETLYRYTFADFPEARDVQRQLDQNTTLFSYYSTAQILYAWVISRSGVHMEKIRIAEADIEKLIEDYQQAVAMKDRSRIDALAEKAYDTYLKPVIKFMNGDRVVFIPHGALSQFPFAAMRYMKANLVDVFSVFYLPHAGMLKYPKSKVSASENRRALIIARPDREGEGMAGRTDTAYGHFMRIYPRNDYVAQAENPKEILMKLSGDYEVIYFDAECYLTDGPPRGSGFLLSSSAKRGGYLAIADLFKLSVRGRISIIASCLEGHAPRAVAVSRSVLVSSLLYASTPAVLMPLWHVDKKAEDLLLERFYKHLRDREDLADALKEAQNDMIRSGVAPSEWAGMILFQPILNP